MNAPTNDPEGDPEVEDRTERTGRALSHRERFLLEQFHLIGHTEREIGEMLGIPEEEVRSLRAELLRRPPEP